MTTTDINQVDPSTTTSERGLLIMVLVMVLLGAAGIVLMAS